MTLAASPAVTARGDGGPDEARAEKVEKSETVLTQVARSSPQRRRPISPQAINTNKRAHFSAV